MSYSNIPQVLSNLIHKHVNILSTSLRCTNVFKANPFAAFRRSHNLSNILVSAKLHVAATITNQPRGSCGHFGDNCLTCNYINNGLAKYTFNSSSETRLINHHIDCNSKNVIYIVQLSLTKRRLKNRFNENRHGTRSEHFLCNNHNASDMQLIPLALVQSNYDSV